MQFVHIPYSDEKAISSFLSYMSYSEAILKANICGYFNIDIQEDFEKLNIKDFLLVKFKDRVVPFQILKKNDDRSLEILSYYILEKRRFDENTNIWKDSEIRKYLNSDFLKNFDKDFLSHLREKTVHTEDYITKDRFWFLSHEEVNCERERSIWFKHNENCFAYSVFSDNDSRKHLDFSCAPCDWWLRSADLNGSYYVGIVYSDGYVHTDLAYHTDGVLPACTIC